MIGECTGNTRSTPTWKLTLRTVKVSRTPSPWRPSTTPWKTWTRERLPSTMLTWTLTVSPGPNSGMSLRSDAWSMASMMFMMNRFLRPPQVAREGADESGARENRCERILDSPVAESKPGAPTGAPVTAQGSILPHPRDAARQAAVRHPTERVRENGSHRNTRPRERTPMIELRTPAEIEAMRPAGRFVAETLETLRAETKVGTNLLQIDRHAHDLIRRAGAESCYLDYAPSFGSGPFGYVICTSVNDAVLHGRPFDYAVRDGDLVTLDFAVSIDGWVADSAVSFVVGTPRDEDLRLIETTERALEAGIAAAQVGGKVGDISAAIAQIAHGEGLSINTDFGGHGVGRTMHGDPHIPNDGRAGRGFPLKSGLVIAIEPWFLQTTDELVTDERDGWTLRSADGSRGAHSEHTIAITDDGPVILTDRSGLGG